MLKFFLALLFLKIIPLGMVLGFLYYVVNLFI